jgi:hypothetical protein
MNKGVTGKRGSDSLSEVFGMSVLAGLSGVFVEAIIIGSLYLFDPVIRMAFVGWTQPLLWVTGAISLAGFGISLWFTLAVQIRRDN